MLAIEIEYRAGLLGKESTAAAGTHVNGILSPILGVLVLLLGLPFSLSLVARGKARALDS